MSPSVSTLVALEEPDIKFQKLHVNGGSERNAAQTPKSPPDARAIVDSLMKERFSCRYFLPTPVPQNLIEEIIDVARFSPSGNNIQPWEKVYCISGSILEAITADMLKAFQDDPTAHKAQYNYYPAKGLPEAYARRRQEFGKILSAVLNIEREDHVARTKAAGRNYQFYNAPVAFIFTIDKALTQGSWLDVGYFLQSMGIAARARGLETVSMESVAHYQAIFRRYLPIGEDSIIAVGMAMGYPDVEEATRLWAPQPRREVSDIIQFFS